MTNGRLGCLDMTIFLELDCAQGKSFSAPHFLHLPW